MTRRCGTWRPRSAMTRKTRNTAELLTKIKQDAARAEYQRGLQFYEKRQLDQALVAFEKAKSYNPSFAEATRAYETVRQRRDLVQTVVTDIPNLIAAGKPDEALAKLAEVEQFAADLPRDAQSENASPCGEHSYAHQAGKRPYAGRAVRGRSKGIHHRAQPNAKLQARGRGAGGGGGAARGSAARGAGKGAHHRGAL